MFQYVICVGRKLSLKIGDRDKKANYLLAPTVHTPITRFRGIWAIKHGLQSCRSSNGGSKSVFIFSIGAMVTEICLFKLGHAQQVKK